MRKFYFLTLFLIFLNSVLLGTYFRYSLSTVLFHLLVMLAGFLLLQALVAAPALFISRRKPFAVVLHTLCFGYFFLLLLLYILIFASNYFWKKTIMFSIIKNYFLKIGNFVSALPIQGWIFYSTSLAAIAVAVLLYVFFRPHAAIVHKRTLSFREKRYRLFYITIMAGAVLSLLLLKTPLLKLKRNIQFAEEPVAQFLWGNLWGQGNEMAFDKERFILGRKDEACLDSLRIVPRAGDHAVVVIMLDALRSDHLPMYGYARNTTPFLDSLHKNNELLVVKNAFSTSTGTVAGVAGMFYSRDWTEFGYNGLNIMKYLKKANYTTYAFLTGYHRDWFGLSALYRGSNDYYYESPQDPDIPPDDDMVTIKTILQTPLARRSFTYIHLLSTHTIGKKDPQFRRFVPDKIGFGTDKKTALENNYDNGILQADHVIRQIFGKLKRENILQNCTVFILADHGELFGEDGRWSHGGSVHPKLISIPLLVYDPQKDWYTNLEAATLKDIAPTIADRLAYPIPACWEGRSLHQPAQDFSVEINSAAECDYPFGLLRKQTSGFQLQIMDGQKKVHKIAEQSNGNWQTAVQAD